MRAAGPAATRRRAVSTASDKRSDRWVATRASIPSRRRSASVVKGTTISPREVMSIPDWLRSSPSATLRAIRRAASNRPSGTSVACMLAEVSTIMTTRGQPDWVVDQSGLAIASAAATTARSCSPREALGRNRSQAGRGEPRRSSTASHSSRVVTRTSRRCTRYMCRRRTSGTAASSQSAPGLARLMREILPSEAAAGVARRTCRCRPVARTVPGGAGTAPSVRRGNG